MSAEKTTVSAEIQKLDQRARSSDAVPRKAA